MTSGTLIRAKRGREYPRVLGSYETARPGPTFIVSTGIHGNEPAGAEAALRVCAQLTEYEPELCGRFLAVAGNLGALACAERYLDQDLNRLWTKQAIAESRAHPHELRTREQREQHELLGILDACFSAAGPDGDVVVLDLHSSSADGAPFSCMGDTLRNRKVAFALPIPVILGLEETIDGAMLDYVYERGHIAIAIEGGRHEASETIDNLENALWIALVAAGCLRRDQVQDYEERHARLARTARGVPSVLEIRHREELLPSDRFQMERGWTSFQPVAAGQRLALKNGEPVCAREAGRMLLPLYQGQGSDGFFLCRRVRPFWLKVSALLRRVRFSRFLRILPGVHRHPTIPDTFVVDLAVAVLKPVEIFHLLGFRRLRREGETLVFSRRREHR